jgi:hypothetical protein
MQSNRAVSQFLVTDLGGPEPTENNKIKLFNNVYDTVILTSTDVQYVYLPLLANCTLGQEFEIVTANNSGGITTINQNAEEPDTPFANWIINKNLINVDNIIGNGNANYTKLVVSIDTANNIDYKVWRIVL